MMNARVMQHLGNRAPNPHGLQAMGPRMQPGGMLQLGNVNQGMPGSYVYPNPNGGGPQGVPIGKFLM